MSRWFRHYAGMMRDDKLVRVAIRSKQPIERVVWIWGAILESAAEIDDNGRFDVDAAEIAYFLRADEDDVGAVLSALAGSGHLAGDIVVKWGDRQFQSDRSNARVAAHRERKRAEKRGSNGKEEQENDTVTLPERDGIAPETETETETELEDLEAYASPASGDAVEAEEDVSDSESLRPEHVVEAWNDLAKRVGKPCIRALTPERRVRLKARISGYSLEDFREVLGNVERSPFLRGDTGKHFCTFDWITKKANFQKVLEGNYNG